MFHKQRLLATIFRISQIFEKIKQQEFSFFKSFKLRIQEEIEFHLVLKITIMFPAHKNL